MTARTLEDLARIEVEMSAATEGAHKDAEDAHPKTVSTFGKVEHLRAESHPRAILTRGDRVRVESVNWLWNGWLAAGKLHLIGGAPGCGKTTIAGALAATVSTGGRWPDGTRAPVGNAVMWSGEDGVADTLAPRMRAAGADMSRIHFVSATREKGTAYPFDPARDVELLDTAIADMGDVRLLIVDPIVSATAGDSHKNAEVRRGLQPLVDIGLRHGCAILGVTHFSKGTAGRDPVERITGSLAFSAFARVVMVAAAGEIGADGRRERLLVRAKNNLGPDGGGFEYGMEYGHLLPDHPDVVTSRIQWGARMDGSARALLDTIETVENANPSRSAAAEWLRSLLVGGGVPTDTVKEEAKAAGYAWATLRRARDEIGAKSRKTAMGGGWVWELPPKVLTENPEDAEGAHAFEVSTFGDGEHLRDACPRCDGEGCEWCR